MKIPQVETEQVRKQMYNEQKIASLYLGFKMDFFLLFFISNFNLKFKNNN